MREICKIGRHQGLERRVCAGGGGARIFGRTPADLAREQNLRPGYLLAEDLFDAEFVGRVGVAMQKRDGDGGDSAGAKLSRGAPYGLFVQATAHAAVGGNSLIDFLNQFERDNGLAISAR